MRRRAAPVIATIAVLLIAPTLAGAGASAPARPPSPQAGPPDADNPDDIPRIDGPDATAPEDPSDRALATSTPDQDDDTIPVPPAAPRIANGADYETCLDRIEIDAADAARFAAGWAARGGGIGAAHCQALAEIALGGLADGAARLDRLAHDSTADAAARATVFEQAGQAWMLAGRPAEAAASDSAALALTPDDPDVLIDRARAYAALARLKEAVDDLDQALDIEPKRTEAMVARAGDLRRLDRLDEAQDDVNRALALDPEDPDALLERGIIRQRQGDLGGARSDWEQASNLAPDSPTGDMARQDLALLEAGPLR